MLSWRTTASRIPKGNILKGGGKNILQETQQELRLKHPQWEILKELLPHTLTLSNVQYLGHYGGWKFIRNALVLELFPFPSY